MMGTKLLEKGQLQKCSQYGGEGHNKRGCKGVQSSGTSSKVELLVVLYFICLLGSFTCNLTLYYIMFESQVQKWKPQ